MKLNKIVNKACKFFFPGVAGLLLVYANTLNSAPGALSDVPLYMGTGAKPNVLWVVDDSGSMDYEIVKRRSAESNETGYPEDGNDYENDEDELVLNPTTKEEVLEMCVGYNALAYNPGITYEPWVDSNGAPMPEHDVSVGLDDVPDDPEDLNGSDSSDLSDAKYVLWNDANSDGNFDKGECGEDVNADSNDSFAVGSVAMQSVSSLSLAEQQNFTNWYTYYRKRGYVMKAILSGVFSTAEDRFGLATLKSHSYIGAEIGDMSDSTHRSNIISRFLDVPMQGNTPLRRAMLNAGKYYDQEDNDDPANGFVGANNSPSSPIQYSCQANYTVMVTDGYANEYGNPINVGNVDGDTTNEFAGGYYADTESNTMADLAMYYYSTDLDTNLEDNFRSNNALDTNSAQHMVTYALAFGVEGNIDTSLVPNADGVLQPRPIADNWASGSNGWPTNINDNSPETIDDLYHATFNSRGQFFNSSDPEELKADIQAILDSIAQETEGTAAAVGVNSTSVSTDTLLFQAWFSSEAWSGELRAYSFGTDQISASGSTTSSSTTSSSSSSSGSTSSSTSSSGGPEIDFDTLIEEWEASDVLGNRDLDANPRVLLTWSSWEDTDSDTSTAEGAAILFDAPTDISTITAGAVRSSGEINYRHLSDLMSHSYVSAAGDQQAAVENLVDWIKGHADNEGSAFRSREKLLGDIVSSSPQYVGVPSERYPNHIEGSSNPYLNFVSAKGSRTEMVYVGSNDGMLHGFNAENGEEVFAYLPELLFTTEEGRGYHELAELDYAHVPYVDGSPTVRDVFVNNAWKSYLVGTLNGGGKGVYVLDVTDPVEDVDPSTVGATPTPTDIVVGEFTHDNLGYTYARAQIAKLNNGKWAAIFGNGYNNTGHGQASLFILYLEKVNGEFQYEEITTGVGSITNNDCADNASDCNGLSSPSILDLTGDGIVDRVYAGDVHGNMWAFDLSSTSASDWGIAHGTNQDEPLFTACRNAFTGVGNCTEADRQPITSKPVIVSHRSERALSTAPNLMVMFGTGQFIAEDDPSDTSSQSFYGVWDAGLAYGNLQRARLVEREIGTTSSTDENGDAITVRTIDTLSVNVEYDETAVNGWYMDLSTSKERSVLTPLIIGDFVIFVTSIPDSGVCTGGGSGWLMAVDIFTGEQPDIRIFNDITDATAGIPLGNLSGGMIGLEDKLIGADSVGNINVYDYKVYDTRPGTRSSFKILR